MDADSFESRLQQEIDWAVEAWSVGNEGKARVCARRAAGLAIRYFFQNSDNHDYARDAVRALRRMVEDESVPETVRTAARRLAAKAKEEADRTTDPVGDALIIVTYFFPKKPSGGDWRSLSGE